MNRFFYVLCLVSIFSCNRKSYIEDLPIQISFDQSKIEQQLQLNQEVKSETDLYLEELSEHEIYIREKYSKVFNVLPQDITNVDFYSFINEWLYTPYSEVGFSEKGLNMPLFVSRLYQASFNRQLPKSPKAIFNSEEIELFSGRNYLEEGDIIFLRYSKDNPVSDVAVYLRNDLILASTPKRGLAIFDFNTDYFQNRFLAAGRLVEKTVE